MNKKSGFLTFCFALVPGAGQMYLGYMKRGCSFMLTLALLVTLVSTFSTVLFPLLVAVLWCVTFFDTFHVAAYTEEQRRTKPDEWLWNTPEGESICKVSHYKAVGIGCIVLGAWLCLDQLPGFLGQLGFDFGGITWVLRRYIPSVVLALALIWMGFRFIAGPKKPDESATWQPERAAQSTVAAETVLQEGEGKYPAPQQTAEMTEEGAVNGDEE